MRVWSQLSSPHRQYFKDMTIQKPEFIHQYLSYLTLLNSRPNNDLQDINQKNLRSFKKKDSKNKSQTLLAFNQSDFQNQQHTGIQERKRPGNEAIQVINEDGKIQKIPMRNLVPMANLQLLIENKSFNPSAHLYINERALGPLKAQILQKCHFIPISQIVTAPNIISMVQSRNNARSQEKKFKKSQKRSLFLPVNQRIYFQLVNREIPLKQLNYQNITNSYFLNQYKQLYNYYEQKIQQLLIDKELTSISLYVITGNFLSQSQSRIQNSFTLVQKKYIYSLFNFFEQKKNKFWPYETLSLKSILTLYDIFLDKTHYKLSIFFDQVSQSVQKIEVKPFPRFTDSMIGKGFIEMLMQTGNNKNANSFSFEGSIFQILINASSQMKAFYKIPDLNSATSSSSLKVTLQDLIEIMSGIGFKMGEISLILRNFALIMNVILLEVQEKQQKMNQFSTFHMGLKQNSGYKNIRSLYGGQLHLFQSILLNQQIKTSDNSLQNDSSTLIKKQILATILWQLAIDRFCSEINSKIQNISKDLSKTKKFQIFCHYNSKIGERLDEQFFIEDGTLQQTEYQIVGKNLVEKQFSIERQNQDMDKKSIKSKQSSSDRKNNKKIDSPLGFRNFIQKSYLADLEKQFTSFNSYLLNSRKLSFNFYNLMIKFPQIKRIAEQIFRVSEVEDTSQKYWKQFFQLNVENNGKISQINYIICGDYQRFTQQQKQGKFLLDFFTKLIVESVAEVKKSNQEQVVSKDENQDTENEKFSQNNQIQKLYSLTPRSQLNTKSNFFSSESSQVSNKIASTHHSNKRKNLFIETQNLQYSQAQSLPQFQSSIMKTPKRVSFSIELPHLLNKYLYGRELIMVYRFCKQISPEFAKTSKPFNLEKIQDLMQQSIIQISQIRGQLIPSRFKNKILPQKLNDNQQKKLSQLQNLNIFYDVVKQTHYIEASENLFFKIQQQTNLQKQAIHKIIRLFRTYKFRNDHELFMFRKAFLKKIHKLCRLAKFAQRIYLFIQKKNQLLLKISLSKLKLKVYTSKLIEKTQKVFNNLKRHHIVLAFSKIKNYSSGMISCDKIVKSCEKLLLNTKKEVLKQLKPGSYSLTVTSPSGTRKNLDVLSIDVQNVNDSSVVHSGNMSTSNVKNLLNKSDDKKSFMKKDGPQEVDIGKQKQEGKESNNKQKGLQDKKGSQQKDENIGKNQNSQTQKPNQPINKPPLQDQKPSLSDQKQPELSAIPQTIDERSEMSKSKVSQLSKSKVSQLSNDVVSVLNSGMSGSLVSCKSQHSQKLTKNQLFTLKDSPFFSFESWSKQTKTFHPQTDVNKPSPVLFRKLQAQKIKVNEQTSLEICEEVALKQKIVNASYVGFLKDNINKSQKQSVQQICYYQKKGLQKPLLKNYSVQKHGQFYKETFNHILKLSLFKNTSKKLFQLLNLLLKPIKDVYRLQKSSRKTVFQDEPLLVNSYDSVYNLYRDEMFVQFAKQLMGNKDEDSLNSITFVLQIITKNYYPSPKLFYSFLNFIKTNQLSKPQLYSRVYENLIKFAQALEGYKGSHIRLYRQEPYKLTQLQYNQYLQPRQSLFVSEQCKFMANKIIISLFNGQKFEFIIRNETLRTVKKRMLVQLGFARYQKNFGLYEQRHQSNYYMISQKQKAIDYLARTVPNPSVLTLRLRHYYPIKFTDINSLRMFYLNQISQEIRLPFKSQEYEHLVALGISFDEFQQTRIGNYMYLSKKQKLGDEELKGIKDKLELYAQVEGDRRICEFEYFKTIKQFNFLLAKSYKVSRQKPKFMQQIDKLIVKPKQLCFYACDVLKSSLSLYRIKSFYFQNQEVHIELIYSDRDLSDGHDKKFHGSVKSLTLKGFSKMNELYEDIMYYTQLLQLGKGY